MKPLSLMTATLGLLALMTGPSRAQQESRMAKEVRAVIPEFPLFGQSDVGGGPVTNPLKVRYRVADARTLLALTFPSGTWKAEMEAYWEITPFPGPPRTAEQMQA